MRLWWNYDTRKRVIDVAIASFSLAILLPTLMPLIWVLIRLTSKGPVIYRQERLGKDGVPFVMLKFRTMFSEQCDNGSLCCEPTVKDPRITRIGRLIRPPHVDEFPQFFNVLRGEMSILGPRPRTTARAKELNYLGPTVLPGCIPLTPRELQVGWNVCLAAEAAYCAQRSNLHDLWRMCVMLCVMLFDQQGQKEPREQIQTQDD